MKNVSNLSDSRLFTVILLVLVVAIIYLTFFGMYQSGFLSTVLGPFDNEAEELLNENQRLKDTLASILQSEQKVLYEDEYRNNKYYEADFKIYPLDEVIEKGNKLEFKVTYNDLEYLRPIYNPGWRTTYYRGWTYLPTKIIEARHNLYIYSIGASMNYDILGSLGFEEGISVDAHNNINFLIYKFNVNEVILLDNQITLVGTPTRSGVQIVSVAVNDILPQDIDFKKFLFQLSTEGGYEVDYFYDSYVRTEYKKKIDRERTEDALSYNWSDNEDIKELKRENRLLKEELSKYIPLSEEVINEDMCRRLPINNAIDTLPSPKDMEIKGTSISYKIHYDNLNYKRPIYHPIWKKNYEKGWAYIPDKICLNLHQLFILPEDEDKGSDLLGRIGFFQQYDGISKGRYGLLIFNFNINSIALYNGEILVIGTPNRTGAQIVSIDKNLVTDKDALVRLITPDMQELDFDILK